MGATFAQELAADPMGIGMRAMLAVHLRNNHYPPVPVSMVEPCVQAIEACNAGDSETLIDLPEGVSWRGETNAPAWAIVDGHHLSAWLEEVEY